MAWDRIPNELVQGFTGRTLREPELDGDLEIVYKPIRCPADGCEIGPFTSLTAYSDHVMAEHPGHEQDSVPASPVMQEATASRLIL